MKKYMIISVLALILITVMLFIIRPYVNNRAKQFKSFLLSKEEFDESIMRLNKMNNEILAATEYNRRQQSNYTNKLNNTLKTIDSLRNENTKLKEHREKVISDIDSLSVDDAIVRMSKYYKSKGISNTVRQFDNRYNE